jgi:hypothetical protein
MTIGICSGMVVSYGGEPKDRSHQQTIRTPELKSHYRGHSIAGRNTDCGYQPKMHLGVGSYGCVYVSRRKRDGAFVGQKTFHWWQKCYKEAIREMMVMYTLRQHPNILQIQGMRRVVKKKKNLFFLIVE